MLRCRLWRGGSTTVGIGVVTISIFVSDCRSLTNGSALPSRETCVSRRRFAFRINARPPELSNTWFDATVDPLSVTPVTGSKRKRNYANEYLIRIARGLAGGKSRSQARGHARAADLPSTTTSQPFKRSEPLEDGRSEAHEEGSVAAKQAGVSAETLRRFQKANTTSHRKGRRWLISDTRPVSVVMATRGKMRAVKVSHDAASDISRHWTALNLFLKINDPSHLAAFVGKGLRDSKGVFHPFETRPNVLRKLDSVGELSFIDIYRQTTQH
jgi:hypothetical protein